MSADPKTAQVSNLSSPGHEQHPEYVAHQPELNDREFVRIGERRNNALKGEPENALTHEQIRQDLVGLALSGGGIRSGAVSLGFLQAVYQKQCWPYIDYLSTVSGGGYAGGMVTAAASVPQSTSTGHNNKPDTKTNPQVPKSAPEQSENRKSPDELPPNENRISRGDASQVNAVNRVKQLLGNEDGTRSTAIVRKLIHNGRYLIQFQEFLNRYVFGLLVCLGICVCVLVSVCALAAWGIRLLDNSFVRDWLSAIGVRDDVLIFFLPMLVTFASWMLEWGLIVVISKYSPKLTEGKLWRLMSKVNGIIRPLTILGTAMAGVAALAGSHEIDLYGLLGILPEKKQGTIRNLDWITNLLIPAILAALVPYLAPRRLLRSGTHPTGIRDKVVYQLAAAALAVGVPFLLMMHFARENVSGVNKIRDGRFEMADISTTIGWEGTSRPWYRLKLILSAVAEQNCKECTTDVDTQLQAIAEADREIDVLQASDDVSWRSVEQKSVLLREVSPSQIRKACAEAREARAKLLVYINRQLIDNPCLVQALRLTSEHKSCETQKGQTPTVLDTLFCDLQKESSPDNASAVPGTSSQPREKRSLPQVVEELYDAAQKAAQRPAKSASEPNDSNKVAGNQCVTNLSWTTDPAKNEWHRMQMTKRNRDLVATLVGFPGFGDNIIGPTTVLEADQRLRWRWFIGAAVAVGVLLLAGRNVTSLSLFYEHCLTDAWITPVVTPGHSLKLKDLRAQQQRDPYHLITGTAFLSDPSLAALGDRETGESSEPDRNRPEEFLFSPLYCGAESTGYSRTSDYDRGEMTLPRALAISGAAVSPIQQPHLMMRAICFALNLQLGRWCPVYAAKSNWPGNWVPGIRVVRKCWREFRLGSRGESNLCYVTDGGVHENLGIRVLLKRRCRLIIACDAGCDSDYVFEDLAHLLRWCRTRDGIEITPLAANGIESLRPLGKKSPKPSPAAPTGDQDSAEEETSSLPTRPWADSHFTAFEIKYPPLTMPDGGKQQSETGLLLYFKSVLTGDEPMDLKQYALSHPTFPQDSTADQFYSPEQFESYRQLGFHLFDSVCSDNTPEDQSDDGSYSVGDSLFKKHESIGLVDVDVYRQLHNKTDEFVPGGCAQHIVFQMLRRAIQNQSGVPRGN